MKQAGQFDTLRSILINGFLEKTVIISPIWIESINWEKEEVIVNMTCDAVKSAPVYDPSKVISDEYQDKLSQHYKAMGEDYPW